MEALGDGEAVVAAAILIVGGQNLQHDTASSAVPIKSMFNQRSDRKSTRLNSSHSGESRMPSSA